MKVLERLWQENDHEFDVSIDCTVSSRLTWATTGVILLQTGKETEKPASQ